MSEIPQHKLFQFQSQKLSSTPVARLSILKTDLQCECVCSWSVLCVVLGFVYRHLSWVSYHVLSCFSLQKPTVILHSPCCQSLRLTLNTFLPIGYTCYFLIGKTSMFRHVCYLSYFMPCKLGLCAHSLCWEIYCLRINIAFQ